MKKILFYNWVHLDDPRKRGGGVSVYQKNLITHLGGRDDLACYYLSSGMAYTLKKKATYIEETASEFGEKCRCFQVVNSPVLAPSAFQAGDEGPWLEDTILYDMLKAFITGQGGFDVIHFNNFEGLSLQCLTLKNDFPDTRFVYSLHNYYAVCPGVTLWYHNQEICSEEAFACGRGCIGCPKGASPSLSRLAYIAETGLSRVLPRPVNIKNMPGMNTLLRTMRTALKRKGEKTDTPAALAAQQATANKNAQFREKNVAMLNQHFDVILAVSNRVRDIALHYGILPEKVHTAYIGTKFASQQVGKGLADPAAPLFKAAYIGYANTEKGFYSLINALGRIADADAKGIALVFAVKTDDKEALAMLDALRARFASLEHYNGYTHDQLPAILGGVHLGIVPVLWEDNLPQVAIEMAAHGVPVLASDVGGPSELSGSKDFIVPHGDEDALAERIVRFSRQRELLDEYWKHYKGLRTMQEHIDELTHYYFEHA